MATRFQVIHGAVGENDELGQRADEAMEEIGDADGRFVKSHWAVAGPASNGVPKATLVIA